MATRKVIDWEAVETSFRCGSPSVRALADKHGITEGAIRKRATKEGWQRDLTDKVKAATKEKLVRAEVRTESTRTDAEIIDEESDKRVAVVLSHRGVLSRWAAIAERLAESLDTIDIDADSAGDFARSLNAGVDAQLKVIKGQRQAYNIDTTPDDDSKAPAGLGHFYADQGDSNA